MNTSALFNTATAYENLMLRRWPLDPSAMALSPFVVVFPPFPPLTAPSDLLNARMAAPPILTQRTSTLFCSDVDAAGGGSGVPSTSAVDLLRKASARLPNVAPLSPPRDPRSSSPQKTTSATKPKISKKDRVLSKVSFMKAERTYIDEVQGIDILCGRGGRSNHHPGNKQYRQVVSEMKQYYRETEGKSGKTELSRAIVDHVCDDGQRFVKKDESVGRYYILSKAEARKKTSQALRETKSLKWTDC
ncbi:expressed unknown protein [Seminavis robusta]|uniref:DUF6824 domain-containing protein n=1 Tax=Seminavis robusta TaxID=568900 RepID=A0A9N8DY31_9STRA|nr:expressed unknown protein [Seminavis robusta]|eukprot:Sro436_g142720.1 n/a (246) ;mRNA; r:59900-60731